ncbi:immunoglobulin kappa light chain-like [Toxotes jaculatrix]|uniref:immunoglobulin kappa light chain-like n=1 Tax=Toxotes jaculatrix TaxID=941984 RepID=UPI001B3A8591|nr:immunoglobulin kappa light chain-like [Toxotes jaculatrix]
MIGRLAAVILFSTICQIQTAEVPRLIPLTEVEVGDNVTFHCSVSEKEDKFFYWYKQPPGYMVQTVADVIVGKVTVPEKLKNSRFTVTKGNNQYVLTIRNVSKEDEAAYFCQTGSTFSQTFVNGTFLAVKDQNQQKHVYVKQSPEKASVQLGDSVTLQCSLLSKNNKENKENKVQCPGEHSVHWFRSGSGGFHPGIIYTHSKRSEQGRSCVYSLSKTMQNSSDAGTYYCAVVTCGEILFGEGTKVETGVFSGSGSELDPVVIVLGVLLACCVTVIAVLILFIYQRKVFKGASPHHGHDKSNVDQSNDLDGDAKEANYAALNFSTRRVKREKKKRELPTECVYSDVAAH